MEKSEPESTSQGFATQTQTETMDDFNILSSPDAIANSSSSTVRAPEPSFFARLISLDPSISEIQLFNKHGVVEQPQHPERENLYTLGRGSKCHFKFTDARISGAHCHIYTQINHASNTREVWVVDVSANGTFMQDNGYKKQQIRLVKGVPKQLMTGDEVYLVNPSTVIHNNKSNKNNCSSSSSIIYHSPKESSFLVVTNVGHFAFSNAHAHARVNNYGARPPTYHVTPSTSVVNGDIRSNIATATTGFGDHEEDIYLDNSQEYAARYREVNGSQSQSQNNNNSNHSSNSNVDCHNTSVVSLLQKGRKFYDSYDMSTEVLGTGSYAQVREARRKKDGSTWAVKIISTRSLAENNKDLILREAEMLRSLRHKCITHLEDVFSDDGHVYLVMEMCLGGDLFDRITHSPNGRYSEEMSRELVQNVLRGVKFLHDNNIAHRDIKPENILLTSRSCDVTIKISDFGLAKRVDETSRLRSVVGTPVYYAPEIMQRLGKVQGLGEYSVEADMWSVGVLVYVTLCGRLPWSLDDIRKLEDLERAGKPPLSRVRGVSYTPELKALISASALDLIAKLLVEEPHRRLTVHQALTHPWIIGEEERTVSPVDTAAPASTSAVSLEAPLSEGPIVKVDANESMDQSRSQDQEQKDNAMSVIHEEELQCEQKEGDEETSDMNLKANTNVYTPGPVISSRRASQIPLVRRSNRMRDKKGASQKTVIPKKATPVLAKSKSNKHKSRTLELAPKIRSVGAKVGLGSKALLAAKRGLR